MSNMDTPKGATFTDQGCNSPDPVGMGGERAGHPRPSASNCSTPLVTHQASGPDFATGAQPKPGRKLSVVISPSKSWNDQPATPQGNNAVLDLTWDEEEGRSVKRVKMDNWLRGPARGSDGNKMQEKLKCLIKKADKESRHLDTSVKGSNYTKKDIKEAVARLRSLMSQIMTTEMQRVIGENSNETVYIEGRPEEEKESHPVPKQTSDACTQTENIIEEIAALRLRQTLEEKDKSYQKFEIIEKEKWPGSLCRNTEVKYGSPLDERDGHIGFWVDNSDPEMKKGLPKLIKERYPDIIDVEDPGGHLNITTKMVLKDGSVKTREKLVFKLDPGDTPQKTLETLIDLNRKTKDGNSTKLAIPILNKNVSKLKKMIEYVFCNTNKHVTLYTPYRQETATTTTTIKRVRRDDDEAIVVKQGDTNYAELLKKVKTAIGQQKEGIREVKKTKEGALLLVVNKTDGKSEEITKIIKEKIEGVTTKRTNRDSAVCRIFDIDEVTDKEEIKATLAMELNLKQDQVEVTALRPAKYGRKFAIVTIPKESLPKVKDIKRVRIGLAPCRIKERAETLKCFRCWDYGHQLRECQGEDRRGQCLRCGEAGHKVAECENIEKCPLCKVEGHRAGASRCTALKDALLKRMGETPRTRNRRRDRKSVSSPVDLGLSPMQENSMPEVTEERPSTA